MTAFVLAAVAMLAGVIPCGIVASRGTLADAVVAYETLSVIVVLVLILLAEAFRRPGEFELPIVLAVLMFGGGLVFVRYLERSL